MQVTMDKWMNIIDMGYVIASRYNAIFVSLSLQLSMTFFPLRNQPPTDYSVHRVICIGHVYGNHFAMTDKLELLQSIVRHHICYDKCLVTMIVVHMSHDTVLSQLWLHLHSLQVIPLTTTPFCQHEESQSYRRPL